jgi:hypothetical protein
MIDYLILFNTFIITLRYIHIILSHHSIIMLENYFLLVDISIRYVSSMNLPNEAL